jgi:hypothetical protein
MTFVARALLKPNRMLGLAAVIGLSLMASACGGGSSGANVAQVDTNDGAKSSGSSSGSSSGKPDPTAYSGCMRSHGVPNFPDPDSKGRIKITSGVAANGQKTGVDVHSPQFDRARKACDNLLPNGGRPTAAEQQQEQQQMLKFAQCMRSHGVPKFPDPKAGGALSVGTKVDIDMNTPRFQAAQKTCQKLVPGGPIVASPGSAVASPPGYAPKP